MTAKIFINLPVLSVNVAKDFYQKMGMINIPEFSDDNAACMMYSGEIYVMLLTHNKFAEFISKPIANTKQTASMILSLSVENTEMLHLLMQKALKAGATEPRPAIDLGFMQQRSFEDPDGHLWEVIHMDTTKLQ